MKYQSTVLLGVGALSLQALAQECPAGYSPVISVITVTASASPEPSSSSVSPVAEPSSSSSSADTCPAGYSPVTSVITVTATTTVSASQADSATSVAPTSSAEPITTVYTSSTTTSTVTLIPGSATASPVNAVESSAQAESSSTAAAAAASPAASSASSVSSASSSSSASSASSTSLGSSVSGQATFYGGNVAGGACSFADYTLPSGVFGTALSDSNWDDAANCGACVQVTGPSGNSITAMIVDECPGCGENHLDLFPDAFDALAPASEGVINTTWEYVSCPISSPLEVSNKDGVSAYWFSMQVVNANLPVSSLEVSTDGGSTWQSTTRQTYNYFENSAGFGTTTVDVKVTSSTGDVVTIDNVQVASDSSTTASSNF